VKPTARFARRSLRPKRYVRSGVLHKPRPISAQVSLRRIADTLEEISPDVEAYLDVSSGSTYLLQVDSFSLRDDEEEAAWFGEGCARRYEIVDSERFASMPDSHDIHEYAIMESFCMAQREAAVRDEMQNVIRGRGAFRRFKDQAIRFGIIEDWFRYRRREFERIAREWLEEKSIDYVDDVNETEA
jgi:hypothetical protein